MDALVSIIVPVYKVEKFLNRSLDCILAQTYTNWEAILIDDGSPDGSGKICDEYAKRDSRFVVVHKENEGVAAARNTGLATAKGEYIEFIDSDDFAAPDLIKTQMELVKKYNADICVTGYDLVYNGDMPEVVAKGEPQLLDSEATIRKILENQQFCSPWTKLYNKKVFDGVKYPAGAIFEDLMTAFEIFSKADSVVYQNVNLYYYFQASESITRSDFHYGKLDEVRALQKQYEYIRDNYPNLTDEARYKYIHNVKGHLMNLVTKNDDYGKKKYKEFAKILNSNYNFYRDYKKPDKKEMFRLVLMKHPIVYRGFYKITGKS